MFGEGESAEDNAPLEKLEHIARVLSAVPSTVKPEVRIRFLDELWFGLSVGSGILRDDCPTCSCSDVFRAKHPARLQTRSGLLSVAHGPHGRGLT